ncbi:DUF397 domain-containing protein [Streptomyces sp. HNM0574]|uniref:DUF397 domain-containing protein n=1 Tax=Streptomyces sp. HNM0574 TaxID=2714954 RepID=UPI00146E9310|nr:DUF397 domain-containing protein [Streptomyces sp. HNM0574]NLU67846.1 DUF397 domain-containing protein [Streptomyces sp. HNM0574]
MSNQRNGLTWVKSSYSSGQGGACVEVAWTKSSYSASEGGACIEVASRQGEIRVRDSKVVDGVQLVVRPEAWEAFVSLAARA